MQAKSVHNWAAVLRIGDTARVVDRDDRDDRDAGAAGDAVAAGDVRDAMAAAL
jgi:hypothetical protein